MNSLPDISAFVHGVAGNLVLDGQHLYQYDGFSWLIEIRSAGVLTVADFDPNNAPPIIDPRILADPNDPNTFDYNNVFRPDYFSNPFDPNTYNGTPFYSSEYFDDPTDPNSHRRHHSIAYDPNCWAPGGFTL